MLPNEPPVGHDIERFLVETLPSLGPPPRGVAGLDRARRFFALAGDPQETAHPIHVVGTAGKGTASAAIMGRLVGAGERTAAHLSPHVYDIRERFLLDGAMPSWDEVGAALAELWPAITAMVDADGRPPSFFEVTIALSWVIGFRAGVGYQITEAGIGGTLDSTNVIRRLDKITVVTPIGFDHLGVLGRDITEIAANKAGVISEGGIVVLGPQPHAAAAAVVRRVAHERSATVIDVGRIDQTFAEQADAVGQGVVDVLAERDGIPADRPTAAVHLPGRVEAVPHAGRHVVLDGAHNPLKIRALARSLTERPAIVIAALSSEKELEACAAELATLGDTVIACQFTVRAGDRVIRRSWAGAELGAALHRAAPGLTLEVCGDPDQAVAVAVARSSPGDTILATGSFMLLDPVKAALRLG